jgi:hypothetical protein
MRAPTEPDPGAFHVLVDIPVDVVEPVTHITCPAKGCDTARKIK